MATPTFVQGITHGRQTTGCAGSNLKITLPNLTGGNNALILGLECDGTLTIASVIDDKSNTWTAGPSISTGGQLIKAYYALGITAGTQVVTVTFTGSITPCSISYELSEWYNVQTSGAIGPTGTSSATTKSITLSGAPTSGDLVWMWGTDISSLTPGLTSITAGANFALQSANRSQGKVAQTSVSTTSTTAAFTTSGTDTWNCVALTLHQASAGTAPSATGIRIVRVHGEYFDSTAHGMQFPCSGNLLVGLWSCGNAGITAISDGVNTWNLGVTSGGGSVGAAQILYSANATPSSTLVITPTYTTVSAENMLRMVDIIGADVSPHDVDDSRSGTQSTTGNLTTGVITPSQVNSLVFNMVTITWHTITGLVVDGNGHTPLLNQPVFSTDDEASSGGSAASRLAEDDGASQLYNTDTTAITFIYTNTTGLGNPPTGVQAWESVSSVFKAAPAGPPGTIYPADMTPGTNVAWRIN